MANGILTDAERKALQAIIQINDYGQGRAISDSDVYDADFLEEPPLEAYWAQYAPNADYYLSEDFGAPTQIARWLYDEGFTPRQVIDEIKKNEDLFPKDSNGSQQSWFDDVQSLSREINNLNTEYSVAKSSYDNYWDKIDLPKPTETYDINKLILNPQYAQYEKGVRQFIRSKNDGKYTPYEETIVKQVREVQSQNMTAAGITPFNDSVLLKKASLLGVTLPKTEPAKSGKPAGTTINKALGVKEETRPPVPLAEARAAGSKYKTTASEVANAPTPAEILARVKQERGLK
jgi:hypothetical protein